MLQKPKSDIRILYQVLKELPKDISVKHIKSLEITNQLDYVNSVRKLKSVKPLDISKIELFKKLTILVEQLEVNWKTKEEFEKLLETLTPQYQLGGELYRVEEIERIQFGQDDSSTKDDSIFFSVENGIVYLVVIWASDCVNCQVSMEYNQKMIEKNSDWAGRAKIIGISIDDTTEDITKIVNSKKWKSIEHYRFLNGCVEEKYRISRHLLPFVMITNKWGKIVYMGRPPEEDLETRIDTEIKAYQDTAVSTQGNDQEKQPGQELLTGEEYRQLKSSILTLLEALKEADIAGRVVISLEKINIWKADGSKEVLKRSKFVLCYNVNVSQEAKLNSFLENYWNKIPENHRRIQEAKINDPVKQIQVLFKITFLTLGVNINYSKQETTYFSYNAERQEITSKSVSGFVALAENLTYKLYADGMKQIYSFLQLSTEYEQNVESKQVRDKIQSELRQHIILRIGSKFQTIRNYKRLGKKEFTKIEHTQGQVLLLYYCNIQVSPCIDMENYAKMLKENKKEWGNNVRAVSLCFLPIKYIAAQVDMIETEESQKYVEIYFPENSQQPDTEIYGVEVTSHYVVVDKFGTIRQVDDVENVQELVTKLLSEQASQQGNYVQQIENDCLAQLKIILNQVVTKTLADIDLQHIISLELTLHFLFIFINIHGFKLGNNLILITLHSNTFGEKVKIENSKLSYYIRDTQVQQFSLILSKIYGIIPEHNWKITREIQKTVSVKYPGKICIVCQKDLSKDSQQYYSPFKSEHVCCECAEADDKTKLGMQRYKYHDTLIFINGPLVDLSVLNNIEDHKIETNQKLKKGDPGSQQHFRQCHGCDGEISNGPRYVSINNRPGKYLRWSGLQQSIWGYISYCSKCFAVLKDKSSEQAQKIVKRDASQGMVLDSLFTRVLFAYNGSKEF